MTQVPAAWQELPGSELVSSEDESWLHQSRFHLSDSSDDENSNLLSQAYVNAVAHLKKSSAKEVKCSPAESGHDILQLPGRKTAAGLPPLTAAPIKAPTVEPTVSVGRSSPAHVTDTPAVAEVNHKIQQAAAQPNFIASAAADRKTSTQQDTAALKTAEPDEASPPPGATGADQRGAMQALDMLFPQELQRIPSVPCDASPCGNQPVTAADTAAARGLLQSPVANPDVQAHVQADPQDPLASFSSLQYSLSEEQLTLIHENAQQYLQEHEDSPWQLPVLQPEQASPTAEHLGLQTASVSAPVQTSITPSTSPTNAADPPPVTSTKKAAGASKLGVPPTSKADQRPQSSSAGQHTASTAASSPLNVAPLSLELSPTPSVKPAATQQPSGVAHAESVTAAIAAISGAAAASAEQSKPADMAADSNAKSDSQPAIAVATSAALVAVPSSAIDTRTKPPHESDQAGSSADQAQKQQTLAGVSIPLVSAPQAEQVQQAHAPEAKRAQQGVSGYAGTSPKAECGKEPKVSPSAKASLGLVTDAFDDLGLPTTAEAFLATLTTSPTAADHSASSAHAPPSAGQSTAAGHGTVAAATAQSLDPLAQEGSTRTPARPPPLVTALSADQLRAILSSAGLQPADSMTIAAALPLTPLPAMQAFEPSISAPPGAPDAAHTTRSPTQEPDLHSDAVSGPAVPHSHPVHSLSPAEPISASSAASGAGPPGTGPASAGNASKRDTAPPPVPVVPAAASTVGLPTPPVTAELGVPVLPSPPLAPATAASATPLGAVSTPAGEPLASPLPGAPPMAPDPTLFSPKSKPSLDPPADPPQEKRKKKKRKRDERLPAATKGPATEGTAAEAPAAKQAKHAKRADKAAGGVITASTTAPANAASFLARYKELASQPAAVASPPRTGSSTAKASPSAPYVFPHRPSPLATAPNLSLPSIPPLPTQAPAQPHSVPSNILIMQQVHAFSPVPAVGDKAVVAWLKNVKSLVHDPKQKFSLRHAIQAIGEFAIGPAHEEEIFLGNVHHHTDVNQQISLIASLFGVDAMQSQNPSSFHQTYRLTRLVKLPYAGVLDQDTDPVVYSIVKLSRLCHEQGTDKHTKYGFERELKAVMNLAKTMQLNFQSTPGQKGPLSRGAKQRIQQLLKLGYLSFKRPKSIPPNPPLYPPWHGKPLYGPSSTKPKVQSLPSRAAATAAASSGAVPFIPGPAVAPVSLRPVPTTRTPASVYLASTSAPASHITHSDAQVSHPAAAPSFLSKMPAQTAPPSLQPVTASVSAAQLHAPRTGISASDTPSHRPSHSLALNLAAPSSGGHSQLHLFPPAVPTAASLPSSSGATAQVGLPPAADTTAALVAAVGPLFEAFVTQTAAVVGSPDVPVQALVGQVTQDLAAAIAAAALQVIDARRQHGTATAAAAAPVVPVSRLAADASQPPEVPALAAKPQPDSTCDAGTVSHAGTLLDLSDSAEARSQMAVLPSCDAPNAHVPASVVSIAVEQSKNGHTVRCKSSEGSLSKGFSDETAKAGRHVTVAEGNNSKTTSGRNIIDSPPSVSTLGQAAEQQGNSSAAARGASQVVSGSAGGKGSLHSGVQHKVKDSKKRGTTDHRDADNRAAKRPHNVKTTAGKTLEHEGYVVPGINVSKYETGKDKGHVDAKARRSGGAHHHQGSRDVVTRSGSPRSSKSSGRSSSKDFRPISASGFDSSSSHRHGSRSPRELGRVKIGRVSHGLQGVQEGGRRDVPAMPSRMARPFGAGPSPVLPPVLPFEAGAGMSLCQGFGAPDFRPVGLHHVNGAGQQHQEPCFRPLPVPDLMFAPDFTPHFRPGGPAN